MEPLILYVEKLNQRNLPIIFDFDHLCLLLGINNNTLSSIINSPKSYYRNFALKKRSGGKREISVPYPALLYIQRWIYNNILLKIPVSPYSHGFRKNRSIVTNAYWHVKQECLFKIDVQDFFPSIEINRVIAIFKEVGYSYKVSFYLAALCCVDGHLPQGAPTSPYLSNLVCRPLDYRLIKLAKKFEFHYTRYADDLTFSGGRIDWWFLQTVYKIVNEEGFEINEGKTKIYSGHGRRIVTGICVNEKLSVPREFKKKIKQEIYYIKKYGLLDHLQKTKSKELKYCQKLLGRICFWLQVEPKNKFAIQAKYHMLHLIRSGFKDI
ncbi:MAG: retron St85 family RNA-directed DNA polymerase [Muribaculaceae bacterium]|nr:retron St85 family RNA-directed DNA polymerase [Muribaculaceae bacterium]